MKTFTLYELNTLVRKALTKALDGEYWVQAEIASISERGGHCYLELIDKEDDSNIPRAKAKAIVWADVWTQLKMDFMEATGSHPAIGMKVLLSVYPNFHESFGFSWVVSDIDPSYTIGDMARHRQQIIRQLVDEGLAEMNKALELPIFAQHIAIVSSPHAAGYGDFCHQIQNNPYGYTFRLELFEATMQGENVEDSVIAALDAIREEVFDAIVIIRGGGATSDLVGFDSYRLAAFAAQMPFPIITGIGHERDDTVLDFIAHTRVKTPTAAAELLIDNLAKTDAFLDHASQVVNTYGKHILKTAEQTLLIHANRLREAIRFFFERQRHQLELTSQHLDSLDPTLLLRRGYTMTTLNGRIIKGAAEIKEGDRIKTIFHDGSIVSTVTETK